MHLRICAPGVNKHASGEHDGRGHWGEQAGLRAPRPDIPPADALFCQQCPVRVSPAKYILVQLLLVDVGEDAKQRSDSGCPDEFTNAGYDVPNKLTP